MKSSVNQKNVITVFCSNLIRNMAPHEWILGNNFGCVLMNYSINCIFDKKVTKKLYVALFNLK